jgi:hypothetical protein
MSTLGRIIGGILGGAAVAAVSWEIKDYVQRGKVTEGKMAKVLHRERANGVDVRLQDVLDFWAAEGPFDIEVGYMGGVRDNATQLKLWQQGRDDKGNVVDKSKIVTHAKTVDDSAHGHAGALDLWPAFDGRGHPDRVTQAEIDAYDKMTAVITTQYRGSVTSGKDFPGLADWPHFELTDWKTLPVVGKGFV